MSRTKWPLFLVLFVFGAALLGLPSAQAEESMESGFAGADVCLGCHDDPAYQSRGNVHMRIASFEVLEHETGCEGCHGPGAQHAEEADPALIKSFAGGEGSDSCMSCHRVKGLRDWPASTHAMEGLQCNSCHSVHAKGSPSNACFECHAEEAMQFELPSHHPVREGKMSCGSCHDPHSATESMVVTRQRENDLCYKCHQSKEGPFIFEHAPVQEDCSICHTPHGSVANNLLTANEPMICLQCHEFHFHAGYQASDNHSVDVGGLEKHNTNGPEGLNIAFSTSCTMCHSSMHGSDLPTQTVPGRGEGLIN